MSDLEQYSSSRTALAGTTSTTQPVSRHTLELALTVQHKVNVLVEAIHRVTQALADFEQLDVIQQDDSNHEFLEQFHQILSAFAMVSTNLGLKSQARQMVNGLVAIAADSAALDHGASSSRVNSNTNVGDASKDSKTARIKKSKQNGKRGTNLSDGGSDNGMGSVLPLYKMNRKTRNLQELVQEWYHGINGGPSVKALEAKYGSKWRTKNDAERVFLGRRKVIIQRIEELEKKFKGRKTRDQIVAELEQERIDLGKSIDGLGRFYRTRKI